MDPLKLRAILLFPPHVSPHSTTLPLLAALQSLLNLSYTATYCTRPDIFGTSHLRLADPAKFADFIGADGFTIAIFAVKSDQRQRATDSNREDGVDPKGGGELVEIVATGSVRAVDDEDVRRRATQQCAPRAGRVARERNDSGSNSDPISTKSDELDEKLQALYRERQSPHLVHGLQAFAVSPMHRGLGLGARVLETIEWLLGSDGDEALDFVRGVDAPSFLQARLSLSSLQNENGGRVHGVDLDKVLNLFGRNRDAGFTAPEAKQLEKDAANGVETLSSSRRGHRKVVLVAIRELGNEEYYLRRGYKSLGTGILPVGTWDSNAECTTVYMEKSI